MTTKIFNNSFYHLIRPLDTRLLDAAERLDPYPDQEFTWGGECNVKKERFYRDEMVPSLVFWGREFMKEIGFQIHLEIRDIWKNTYRRGSFQEPRDYPNSDLSAVIFLDDYIPGEGGQFYFINRHRSELGRVWGELFGMSGENHYIDYKRGDMLCFPSYMLHGVTPYNISRWDDIVKKKRKRTISINMDLDPGPPWEGSVSEDLYKEAMRIEFNK